MDIQFKFSRKKARAAVAYLISKGLKNPDRYRILKLLFLADKLHLVQYGRPITGDHYVAMPDGPVGSELYNLIKSRNKQFFRGFKISNSAPREHYAFPIDKKAPWRRLLSASDIETIDVTVERHGSKTFKELWDLTHDFPAYKNAWERRGDARSVVMRFEDLFQDDSDKIEGTFEELLEEKRIDLFFSRVPDAD